MGFGDSIRKSMDNELIEPPAGQYTAKVDEASAFESKAGDEYAKVILEITEGDHQGARFQHFMGFKNEIAKQINGEALATYGVDWTKVTDLTDLDLQLDGIVKAGTVAEVTVSYKDGYIQIKVHNSRTTGQSDIPTNGSGFETAAASAFGDDTPF